MSTEVETSLSFKLGMSRTLDMTGEGDKLDKTAVDLSLIPQELNMNNHKRKPVEERIKTDTQPAGLNVKDSDDFKVPNYFIPTKNELPTPSLIINH